MRPNTALCNVHLYLKQMTCFSCELRLKLTTIHKKAKKLITQLLQTTQDKALFSSTVTNQILKHCLSLWATIWDKAAINPMQELELFKRNKKKNELDLEYSSFGISPANIWFCQAAKSLLWKHFFKFCWVLFLRLLNHLNHNLSYLIICNYLRKLLSCLENQLAAVSKILSRHIKSRKLVQSIHWHPAW